MSDDTTERRHLLREERLTREQKMAREAEVAEPGAEYVEVGWQKTASEPLSAIRREVDKLVDRKATPRIHTRVGDEQLPPGLRSRITEAYGAVAYVRLAYTTRDHHVCRIGLREDGEVRDQVVLVTPDDVRPVSSVEAVVDDLPDLDPAEPPSNEEE